MPIALSQLCVFMERSNVGGKSWGILMLTQNVTYELFYAIKCTFMTSEVYLSIHTNLS